jgi:hypothetical protein
LSISAELASSNISDLRVVEESATGVANFRNWPFAAVIIDRLGTTTFEGTTDQSWFQAVVDRRAETAAVNAMASGSQHSTMSALSNNHIA